jgi:hypothetical protein
MDVPVEQQQAMNKNQPYHYIYWLLGGLLLMVAAFFIYQSSFKPESEYFVKQQEQLQNTMNTLLASDDTEEYAWMRSLNPLAKRIDGKLIWNQELQKGMMQLENLPTIASSQSFRAWAFDRNLPDDQPVLLATFKKLQINTNELLVSIQPDTPITSPYKFILTLEDDEGSNTEPQNLLRAQP